MVEGSGLENRQACKRLVGSNPTPSAMLQLLRAKRGVYILVELDWGARCAPTTDAVDAYLSGQNRRHRERLVHATIDGRAVWIKRYDVERRAVGRLLHAAISPLMPSPVFKASRFAKPSELAKREERKIAAFAAAGFYVPHVLLRKDATLVLSHEGPSLQVQLAELRRDDTDAAAAIHDDLLCRTPQILGDVHTAGLCHGRPHTRDMSMQNDRWCFFDFEEEPEAVMPLSMAQARDVWLMFFPITHAALAPDTPARAFDAYRTAAPPEVLDNLRTLVGSFVGVLPILRAILRVRPGGDLGRLRKVTELMMRELGLRDDVTNR